MIDKIFFEKYQRQILFLVNTKIGRWFFKIKNDIPEDKLIEKINPNSFTWVNKTKKGKNKNEYLIERKTDFRTHAKFSKRINSLFKWLPFFAYKSQLMNGEWYLVPKIGLTVSTFYPDAHPESTSFDGWVFRGGVNETFSNIRSGNGTNGFDTSTSAQCGKLNASTTTDRYESQVRGIFLFDTSSLPDGDTINSAIISIYGSAKVNTGMGTPDFHIASAVTSSNTSISNSDYENRGTTSFGNVTYSSFSTSSYNDISLNASGLANISKIGISKFSAQNSWDMLNDTTGLTWQSSGQSGFVCYFADQTGTSNDPKLVVTHTVSLITKDLSETIALTGSITKKTIKSFSETTTLVDTIKKETQKTLSEIINIVSSFASIGVFDKVLSETIILTDTIKNKIIKLFSEAIIIVDNISKKSIKIFSEIIVFTDTVFKKTIKTFSEIVSITDTITKRFAKTFSETIILISSFASIGTFSKILSETVTLTDLITKKTIKTLSETIILLDNTARKIIKTFLEAVSISDGINILTNRILKETISLTSSLTSTIKTMMARFKTVLLTKIGKNVLKSNKRDKTILSTNKKDKTIL